VSPLPAPSPPPPVLPSSAVLTWVAPTPNTDGSAITVPLTYNVYRGTTATNLAKLTSVTGPEANVVSDTIAARH
jgi:hypothetical protein